jgi:hypothetical protein
MEKNKRNSPLLKASTFAIRTIQRTDQKLQKSLLCQRRQKIVLKNFQRFKKIKIHRHTARQTQQTMTLKLNINKTYNDTVDRRPAGNSGFAKKRVQWLIEHSTSHQLLCYVDSFVLRNPLLRKAAKR